ncbi:hypothetical protein F5X99DRAFT_162555 [Biscogniauxia marginata]|nr:hypothetical protein F5X99DRAFT_162555 [Biscogniauxia marginata]
MAYLWRVLVALPLLITFVASQNISTYLPTCAPPCIEDTIRNTTVCNGLDDNTCLCSRMQEVGQNSFHCFFRNCGSIPDARTQVMSGWQNFCSDVQGISNSTSTPSATPSSSPSASTTPSAVSTSTTARDPASAPALSTGAKAGIGVGAGIGSLSVIGGLVFLGFRLGRRKNGNAADHNDDQESGGAKDDAAVVMGCKAQLDGNAVSELQTDYGLGDLYYVKELETRERPAELWHGGDVGVSSPARSHPDIYCPATSGTSEPRVYEFPAELCADLPVRGDTGSR